MADDRVVLAERLLQRVHVRAGLVPGLTATSYWSRFQPGIDAEGGPGADHLRRAALGSKTSPAIVTVTCLPPEASV